MPVTLVSLFSSFKYPFLIKILISCVTSLPDIPRFKFRSPNFNPVGLIPVFNFAELEFNINGVVVREVELLRLLDEEPVFV